MPCMNPSIDANSVSCNMKGDAYQLYLPKAWADDPVRRHKTGIPEDMVFATKPQIALAQLRQAIDSGITPGVVLADAGYGDETAFRDRITELGLLYAVGVRPATSVWAPGVTPLPPKPWNGRGKPAKLLRRGPGHEPVAIKALAMGLPDSAYQSVTWREGQRAALAFPSDYIPRGSPARTTPCP